MRTLIRFSRLCITLILLLPGFILAAPFAYVTNEVSGTVSVIDTASNAVVATVAVGVAPTGVAVNPAGTRVYVANLGSNNISVIDMGTNAVIATVAVGVGPISVAVNPAGTRVYAANFFSNDLAVIDTTSNRVVASVPMGNFPGAIAVNPDGTRVYVPLMGTAVNPGSSVVVVDTATNTIVASVPVGMAPQSVTFDPTGSRAYVSNALPSTLSVIDTATNTVVATVVTGTSPGGIVVNPAGTRVYVANFVSNNVSVIDSATNTAVSTVAVGSSPAGIDVNPAGTRVYVANFRSNNVSVIDTATNRVIDTIAVGDAPAAFGRFIGPAGASSPSLNYQGLWWNAPAGSESGWGINFAHQGDTIFASWFTYDETGKGWWLVMTAAKTASNTYEGWLYQTRGPAFSAAPFDPAQVVSSPVGPGTLSFTDESNGSFAYTVNGVSQMKSITREVFGALPTCTFGAQPNLALATNYQDLWWAAPAASESGWGINFTHQGDTIFATWFTYDQDGSPMWLVVTAAKTAPGTYAGTLYRTTGPAFNAVPFDATKIVSTPVGTASLTFAHGNSAMFAYSIVTANGTVNQRKNLTREVFQSPGTVCR